jgi:hypothetical protein
MSRRMDRAVVDFERVTGAASVPAVPQPPDHGLVGWTFDPADVQSATIIPTAGRLELARVRVSGSTVTSILLTLTVAGATLTAGRNFAALFTDAGALLATSVDQSTNWQTAGLRTCTLAAPQAVTPGSFVRVGFFSNGTTLPTLARGAVAFSGAALNPGMAGPAWRYSTADTGLTTAMPATLGAQTSAATAWWAGLQ